MCVYIYNGPVVNTCFASSFILSMVENTRNSQEAYNTIDERTNTQEVIQEQLGAGNKKTFKFCCCRVLAIVDSVAMNIRVHMSLRIIVFLRVLLGHMVVLVLVFVFFFNESPHCSS